LTVPERNQGTSGIADRVVRTDTESALLELSERIGTRQYPGLVETLRGIAAMVASSEEAARQRKMVENL
jgi:hypothetical protein